VYPFGFGVNYYGEDLTGPEFAERLRADVKAANIEVWLNAMVIEAYPDKHSQFQDQRNKRS